MKILHATAWYPPAQVGGTEIYVAGLAEDLRDLGVESAVLAPTVSATAACERRHEGIRVLEYPSHPSDWAGIGGFRHWLESEKPDLLHLHTWTPACGLDHLRLARELGLRTAWTIHVPAPICLRGTLLFRGVEPCDGRISQKRCGACWAQSRGLPWPLARAAIALPEWLVRPAGFRARDHVQRVRNQLTEAAALSDRIVCVSRFLHEAMLANGVPESKLVRSRQGADAAIAPVLAPKGRFPLRIGFIGRWDLVKGLQVLVEAFTRLPSDAPFCLDVYVRSSAIVTDDERRLRERMSPDARIRLFEDVSRVQVIQALSGFDVLAVPSQCLETGPLSVLEAAQARVPVLGSDIGGIAEWLNDGIPGWSVRFNDVSAWHEALLALPMRLSALTPSQATVRSRRDVAREMAHLYREMLKGDAS